MKDLSYLILVVSWIFGVVLAQGFWSTLYAIIVPFWSWYLVAEKILIVAQVIN